VKIESKLPRDRRVTGTLVVTGDDGVVLYGPVPARGKADQGLAERHGNPDRVTVRPFGDHPSGTYRVLRVLWDKMPTRSYGPAFLALQGVSGDAYLAEDYGREGLAIHGGDPAADGGLRSTEGCLRVTNEAVAALGRMVEDELRLGEVVEYECTDVEMIEVGMKEVQS
jgi:hypothetical protein